MLCPRARLSTPHARNVFEKTFEDTRQWYGFYIAGYVVMPERVHLLLTEPERTKLSIAPANAATDGSPPPAQPGGRSDLAAPLLRLQRMELRQTIPVV
jgi:hypothetical protein